jgi:PKD repeat protein
MKRIFLRYLPLICLLWVGCESKEFLNTCDDQSSTYIPIKAAFVSSKTGSTVTFTDKSENAESYQWDFGDGTASAERNPVKTFVQDKTYNVKLTVKRCGDKTATATEAIDIRCDAPAPTVSLPSKTALCPGESIQLSASCASGTVLWSNGATTSSIVVSGEGTYSAQCNKGGCLSTKSNAYTFTINPKPATPTITASKSTLCPGESVVLTASACINGTITWSNGKTGTSITETPTASISYTARCTQGGCASDNSNAQNITLNKLVVAKSVAGSATGTLLTRYTITFNGEIEFNDPQKNGAVDDHGFIYLAGTADPQGAVTAIKMSLGAKKESSGVTFRATLSGQTSNQFSYRAYVVACDGKTYYGNNLKIN